MLVYAKRRGSIGKCKSRNTVWRLQLAGHPISSFRIPGSCFVFWKSRPATTAWACDTGLLGKHSPSRRAQHGYLLYPTLDFHCSITPQLQLDGIGLGGSKRVAPAAAPETKRNLAPPFLRRKDGRTTTHPAVSPRTKQRKPAPRYKHGNAGKKRNIRFRVRQFQVDQPRGFQWPKRRVPQPQHPSLEHFPETHPPPGPPSRQTPHLHRAPPRPSATQYCW